MSMLILFSGNGLVNGRIFVILPRILTQQLTCRRLHHLVVLKSRWVWKKRKKKKKCFLKSPRSWRKGGYLTQ
jgi:hypothetical protein